MSSQAGPRHDQHAEQAVLGAILGDRTGDVTDEILSILQGHRDFYQPRHSELLTRLIAVRDTGRPVDAITLAQSITPADLARLGGVPYLHTLLESVPTISNGAYYAREVRGLAILRNLQELAARTAQLAATATPADAATTVDRVQADAADVAATDQSSAEVPVWTDMAGDAVDEMARIQELAATDQLPGVPTGWHDLDRLLNNLQGGQVIIVAGRPGIGKSIAGRNIAQHVAMRCNLPALLFTLEMSRTECMLAFIAAGARVPLAGIRAGRLSDDEWMRIARYLGDTKDAQLMIDDTPGATLAHARTVLRRQIRANRKPAVLVWDYLQLTQIDGHSNRQEAVSALSRGFKLLAKEYDIPIVLISQLNRGPEQRSDKRPSLSDLRESGSLEQDADIVLLLHRDDYYDKESTRAGEMDIIVAKNRHGSTDTVTLAAQLHLQRLMDMAIIGLRGGDSVV